MIRYLSVVSWTETRLALLNKTVMKLLSISVTGCRVRRMRRRDA